MTTYDLVRRRVADRTQSVLHQQDAGELKKKEKMKQRSKDFSSLSIAEL